MYPFLLRNCDKSVDLSFSFNEENLSDMPWSNSSKAYVFNKLFPNSMTGGLFYMRLLIMIAGEFIDIGIHNCLATLVSLNKIGTNCFISVYSFISNKSFSANTTTSCKIRIR